MNFKSSTYFYWFQDGDMTKSVMFFHEALQSYLLAVQQITPVFAYMVSIVCVWKMALSRSTYMQAWTVSVIHWWRFVLCYNIVLSVKLEVVYMIGGSNSVISEDSGLLGIDTTSWSEWFLTLQRNIISSFCF